MSKWTKQWYSKTKNYEVYTNPPLHPSPGDEGQHHHHTQGEDDQHIRDALGGGVYVEEVINRTGFKQPMLIREGLLNLTKVPHNIDLEQIDTHMDLIGKDQTVRVIDVSKQEEIRQYWTLERWVDYWKNHNNNKIYNVISLEFSHTRLREFIDPPAIVKELDWIRKYWPDDLMFKNDEGGNPLYPKVLYYFLSGVKGAFTNFHVDFGGSSVWYHVFKGQKVFILIPPTENNLILYQQWMKDQDVFFGDLVDDIKICYVNAGNTLLIPSGWIHAVYTPEDSFVVGGNFLHEKSIELQLKMFQIEDNIGIDLNARFPFFVKLHWFYFIDLVEKNLSEYSLTAEDLPVLQLLYEFLRGYKFLFPIPDVESNMYLNVAKYYLQEQKSPGSYLYCTCLQHENDDESIIWVICEFCNSYYHQSCVATEENDYAEIPYTCTDCSPIIEKSFKRNFETNTDQGAPPTKKKR